MVPQDDFSLSITESEARTLIECFLPFSIGPCFCLTNMFLLFFFQNFSFYLFLMSIVFTTSHTQTHSSTRTIFYWTKLFLTSDFHDHFLCVSHISKDYILDTISRTRQVFNIFSIKLIMSSLDVADLLHNLLTVCQHQFPRVVITIYHKPSIFKLT